MLQLCLLAKGADPSDVLEREEARKPPRQPREAEQHRDQFVQLVSPPTQMQDGHAFTDRQLARILQGDDPRDVIDDADPMQGDSDAEDPPALLDDSDKDDEPPFDSDMDDDHDDAVGWHRCEACGHAGAACECDPIVLA